MWQAETKGYLSQLNSFPKKHSNSSIPVLANSSKKLYPNFARTENPFSTKKLFSRSR